VKRASVTEVKNNLSALIDGVQGGSPVLIVDRGRPVARLEAVEEHGRKNPFLSRKLRPGYKRLMGTLTGGTDTVAIVSENRGNR
jgi:prevent-host-death family protein